MPNAITSFSPDEHARILKLLAGRMSPVRWLSLVVRAHVEQGRPIQKRERARVKGSIRVIGHVPRRVDAQIAPLRSRHHAVSERELLYWIAAEALEKKFVPEDTTDLADVALEKTVPGTVARARADLAAERARKTKERLDRAAAILGKSPGSRVKHEDGQYRTSLNARVSFKLAGLLHAEIEREPRLSKSVALEDALVDWLAKRALARSRKKDLKLSELAAVAPPPCATPEVAPLAPLPVEPTATAPGRDEGGRTGG